jgi:pyrroline-5-carboxylate reductase
MKVELRTQRIGFVGCGAMARALAGGLLAAGVDAERILGADPAPAQRQGFEKALPGVRALERNDPLVAAADVVVLAVKPALVAPVLEGLAEDLDLAAPLWISIAAGVTTEQLASRLPPSTRLVRAMPNTPALVRAGATGLWANSAVGPEDREMVSDLFASVGTSWWAGSEDLMNAVTGLSGSGPAYVFLLLEALGEAGVRVGLPQDAAAQLAAQTVLGAAKLALESPHDPAALREQVSSPGGTTIAGLERLETGGLRATVCAAVEAATARSRELAGD